MKVGSYCKKSTDVKGFAVTKWMLGWCMHNISETDQYRGSASVMVWGGISGCYHTDLVVIQGNLTGVHYRVQTHSCSTCAALYGRTSRCWNISTRQCLPSHRLSLYCILADCRDSNYGLACKVRDFSPTENVWATLGDRINQMPIQPRTVAGLTAALQQEWHAIPQATIWNLLNSMRRRCTTCINARGGHICYWFGCYWLSVPVDLKLLATMKLV